MEKIKYNLVLGSQSPRRKELLKATFLNYSIETSDIEEKSDKQIISDFVMDLAFIKAEDVFNKCVSKIENPLVLGADTIVVIDGKVLGKPKSREEAKEMLKLLSNSKHEVLTGVSLISKDKKVNFYDKTTVEFENITDDLMELYLDTEESMDKAGAYGIQAYALAFIKGIEGSYSNVVGLPTNLVIQKLKEFNSLGDDTTGTWREYFD
jgi:septum formation protein